jgi:hypothetical protein
MGMIKKDDNMAAESFRTHGRSGNINESEVPSGEGKCEVGAKYKARVIR